VRQGPLAELWRDLLAVKQQRSKWLEASICAIEGIWSLTFPDDAAPGEIDMDALNAMRRGFARSVKGTKSEMPELSSVAELFTKAIDEDQDVSQIMAAAGEMRNVEGKLNKKLRWLAWREVLLRTQDVRSQEEVRESLLTQLNQRGLDSTDTPTFLRERILKDPDLEFEDDQLDGTGDSSYVLQNVEVIEQAIENLRTTKIREASRASLARIMAGMGLHARARDLIQRSMEAMDENLNSAEPQANPNLLRRMQAMVRRGNNNEKGKPERWHLWVALNAWLVYQRVEPSRAEEAKAVYDELFGKLAAYERDELEKTAKSLEERIGQTNVAEFLAEDSRSFFSSRELPDEMSKVVTGLNQNHRRGEEKKINDLVAKGISLAMRELDETTSPSLETVARLILEMVEVLRKLKWDKETRPVDQFEDFVKRMPKEPRSPESSRLYFAVLHCAAARAMMDLGREKEAMSMLVDILRWVGQEYMQVLDFVDLVKKEVLLAIELAPRNQRTEALKWLMNSLIQQEGLEIGDDPEHPGVGFEMPFQAFELIQMIDHTLEAAISNEKLVLRRLRDYEEREEARIRYWVQRDQPAAKA